MLATRTITLLRAILALRTTMPLVTALLLLFALGHRRDRRTIRRRIDGRGHRGRGLMLAMAVTIARLVLMPMLRTALRPPHLDHLDFGCIPRRRNSFRRGWRGGFG